MVQLVYISKRKFCNAKQNQVIFEQDNVRRDLLLISTIVGTSNT